jgi:Putative Ig domain
MASVLVAALSGRPSSALAGVVPAVAPTPSPSGTPADFASALPSWVLTALIVLVALIIFGMFALTAYTMRAPEWTLRRMLGLGRGQAPATGGGATAAAPQNLIPDLINEVAESARTGKRTTRTILAVVGFSLLGVVVIAVFALSGQGVRDIRTQVIGSVTTLVSAIAGFYFGAKTAESPGPAAPSAGAAPASAPGLAPGPGDPAFTVGQHGSFTPQVTGTPPPKVTVSPSLPANLALDAATGTISGIPAAGTAGGHSVTLTASNGLSPDATMLVTLTISDPPAAPSGDAPAGAAGDAPADAAGGAPAAAA